MNRPNYMALVCVLVLSAFKLHAQDEVSIRPVIASADLKKLDKAHVYKQDADEHINEANRLNMEVFSVQADPGQDEKTKTRKAGQLESQAQHKQMQASALYEKCNEIKFSVYKKYLEDFWNKHAGEESDYLNAKLLEEQASDNYFQAASYRIDAKRMDNGYAKVQKLSEADNLEIEAIQKQLTALGIYYKIGEITPPTLTAEAGQPPADVLPSAAEPEMTLPGQMMINQEMIEKYNRYSASGQYMDTTLSTGQIAGITDFDTDRMLQLWYDYIYGRGTFEAEQFLAARKDTLQTITAELGPEQPSKPNLEGEFIGVVTDENKSKLIPADEKVIYRVQLSANRSKLSQRALRKMYYGNKSVEMINENGWYKYSVGDFETYEEASNFRKASGISNAFVAAYRKGTRFMPGTTEIEEIITAAPYTPKGEPRMPPGLLFRIQVAASRIPITVDQLHRIYGGDYPVEMVAEEGWYKYQFMGVRLYSDALQIIRTVNTSGAFIVAYESGVKANLAESVTKNKELEETVKSTGRKGTLDDIEFHLQLAASRTAMKPDEIKSLYTGPEPVSIILEGGWYKYHLKAGNSPEMAEQFKQTCGISKAFIVPYQRAAKILYYEAIHESE
jgi:hypothetical protein